VDLSAYAGQQLDAPTLQAATADIMADITALLAQIRRETPPAVPWDPAAGGRPSSSDRTDRGAAVPDDAGPVRGDAAPGPDDGAAVPDRVAADPPAGRA
jgi:1-acyl-sn-glycerol-3-phosphate acyltransferase